MTARGVVLLAVVAGFALSVTGFIDASLPVQQACVVTSTFCLDDELNKVVSNCPRCLASCRACADNFPWCVLFLRACMNVCEYSGINCSYPDNLFCVLKTVAGVSDVVCQIRHQRPDTSEWTSRIIFTQAKDASEVTAASHPAEELGAHRWILVHSR